MYSKTLQIIVDDLGICLNQTINISDLDSKIKYSSNLELIGKIDSSLFYKKSFKFNNEDLYFIVEGTQESGTLAFNILMMMIKRLQSQHKKYEKKTKDQFRINLLTQELLQGKVSRDYINEELKYFNYDSYDTFKLILMEKASYIKSDLCTMTFTKDDLIYILVLGSSEEEISSYLEQLKANSNCPIIYSLYFQDITEASIKYNFLESIVYKSLENELYPLTDFRLSIFLDMIKDSHKEINHLFEPYDIIKTKDELVKTISAYVECKGSYKITCEALDIHKNTLNYRFKKIEKLLDIDLKNPIEFLELLIALHL